MFAIRAAFVRFASPEVTSSGLLGTDPGLATMLGRESLLSSLSWRKMTRGSLTSKKSTEADHFSP